MRIKLTPEEVKLLGGSGYIVTLTPEQDLARAQAFDYWLNVEGASEKNAHRYAWEDICLRWPELKQ